MNQLFYEFDFMLIWPAIVNITLNLMSFKIVRMQRFS